MLDKTDYKDLILESGLNVKLISLLELYITVLPNRQDVFSDQWDVIEWIPRPGNKKTWVLNFTKIRNPGLKLLVKSYILGKRLSKKIYGETATSYIYALYYLDAQIESKKIGKLIAEDFHATEKTLTNKFSSKAIMYLRTLQAFANWLRANLFPALEYTAPKFGRVPYGRGGTDQGRASKLLPDEVISQLFRIARAPSLNPRDKFFLNALVLNTVMQGRIKELATLPVDCLIKTSGIVAIKVFSEKGGVVGVRQFPQVIAPAVEDAVSYIRSITSKGRELIRELKECPELDWRLIVRDDLALRYFTRKFVAEWTEKNKLLDSHAVWSNSLGRVIDAIGMLHHYQGSYRLACESLGISDSTMRLLVKKQEGARVGKYLITDSGNVRGVNFNEKSWLGIVRKNPLAIAASRMEITYEITLGKYFNDISDILDEGLRCQVEGRTYSYHKFDSVIEEGFFRKILPVVSARDGTSLLEAENALFVVPRNFLNTYKTRSNQYQLISDDILSSWLYGQREEDSIFKRYDIRNPYTGSIADFTWHDIRHWLQTVLKRGGLTDVQASLLAGRKDYTQMKVYDHTPAYVRSEQLTKMRQGIKSGDVIGVTSDNYNKLRIEDSNFAEEYLIASTLFVNWMPHGGCTLNLALTPCIHNLSCFSSNKSGELCDHLQVDTKNPTQIQEIERLQKSSSALAQSLAEIGGVSSPQYEHYRRVASNTDKLLKSSASLSAKINGD